MRERLIASDPEVLVYAAECGDIVLEQMSPDGCIESVRIPHPKVHQVTVWMRRLAAEFDGLETPPDASTAESLGSYLK